MLRWDAPGQTAKLGLEAIDLPPGRLALVGIQFQGRRPGQPPRGAVDDGGRDLQIVEQGGGGGGGFRFYLLDFEKQFGLIEDTVADCRRAAAPGGIQLAGLARVRLMPGEGRRHPLAVFQTDPRHRHQKLHGYMRGDGALAHLLLDRLRQKLDQRQPPRYPTGAAVEPAGQFLQSVAETLLHLLKQPALFQRGLVLGPTQRAVQQQGFGFAHRPDHGFHRVAAQLLERRDALVAVDDHVTVRLALGRHHHDGRLLARFSQRGQQPPLPGRVAHPQVLPAPLQLVKLQLHGPRCRLGIQYEAGRNWSLRQEREVCQELLWDQ